MKHRVRYFVLRDVGPKVELDQAETMASVAPGAKDALTTEAYDRLAPEVHGFLTRVVRDPEAAADLLADAFTRLLVEERAGRWPAQPRAWLYRVASNLATSRGRRIQVARRVDRVLQGRAFEGVVEGPEQAVIGRELRVDLDRLLATLPADARLGLLLAAQGFDGESIAATLGRSKAATRTMMCRARMRLRETLREAER